MKGAKDSSLTVLPEYRRFIEDLKARVISARISAARAVNRDLILLYWDIGRGIVEKQKTLGWGESVVEMVAADLRRAFPQMTGFSPRNVWDMRRLYATYTTPEFLAQAVREIDRGEEGQILRQAVAELSEDKKRLRAAAELTESKGIEFLRQLVAEIPWGQNLLILNKLTDPAARLYYLRATARFGWSRNVLLNQIKAGAYERAVDGEEDAQLPPRPAGASGRAGRRDAQEFLQPRIPRHPPGSQGARTGGPADLPPASVSPRTRLRLLLRRPPAPAGARAEGVFHRPALLSPLSQGAGGVRIESRAVRAGIRGQDGFLPEPAQRQGTRAGRPPVHRHHPLRRKGRRGSRIRPARPSRTPSAWRTTACEPGSRPT